MLYYTILLVVYAVSRYRVVCRHLQPLVLYGKSEPIYNHRPKRFPFFSHVIVLGPAWDVHEKPPRRIYS